MYCFPHIAAAEVRRTVFAFRDVSSMYGTGSLRLCNLIGPPTSLNA